MSAVETIGRMLLALGVVLGLMWALARFVRRPLTGKADRVLNVLARQQLSRNASVAVLKVMDRALVVGVTDQGVRLLTETELEPLLAAITAQAAKPPRQRNAESVGSLPVGSLPIDAVPVGVRTAGALDGSVLSPKVWSQLVTAARNATVRR
ncbi:MAG: flagellar protein FliO/FliZ [Pseudonocardiales bacterium]|nr:flagellar protein FliO/FliZ [Pseudonocardiales bacterium]